MKTAILWKISTGCAFFIACFTVFSQDTDPSRDMMETPGRVIIDAGATVINKGALIVKNNWMNNGSYIDTTGTVYFSGPDLQLGGASVTPFNNLMVMTASVVAASPAGQTVRRTMRVDGELAADGYITLLSGPSGTALIDGEGTGMISGDVTMERYLEDGFGYKYFSSPFSDGNVADFSDEIDLEEDFPPFYRYDENRISSGWISYITGTDPLVPLSGYAVNFGASHGSITADVAGTVNNGYLEVTLYNHDQEYTKGFNLIGNPYPSPIDWDAATGWTRINIDDALYFFNASDTDRYTGSYSSYIEGISSDGVADSIIPAMQGFFIHVTDGTYPVSATLACNNNVRTKDIAPFFHKAGNTSPHPHLRLNAGFEDHPLKKDPLVIYFNDSASDDFEPDRDALKLMNSDTVMPSLYAITTANKKLSISGMRPSEEMRSVPLGIRLLKQGYVRFTISEMHALPPGLMVFLKDAYTGKYHRIDKDPELTFHLEEGMTEGRFYLTFSYDEPDDGPPQADPLRVYYSEGTFYINSLPGSGSGGMISLCNMAGQAIWSAEPDAGGRTEVHARVPAGVYIVSLHHPTGVYTTKLLISNP